MKPWLERVVQERMEVAERLSKLLAFIASPALNTLRLPQQVLLREQASVMFRYAEILELRIQDARSVIDLEASE